MSVLEPDEIARRIDKDSSQRLVWLATSSQMALKNFNRAVTQGAQENATPPEILWRVVINNRDINGDEPPAEFENYFDAYKAQLMSDLEQLETLSPPMWQGGKYRGPLQATMKFRMLASTDCFRLAVIPDASLIGDVICVFQGLPVPYVLRPVHGDAGTVYRIIGEAYVHGIMSGEAMGSEQRPLQEIVLV